MFSHHRRTTRRGDKAGGADGEDFWSATKAFSVFGQVQDSNKKNARIRSICSPQRILVYAQTEKNKRGSYGRGMERGRSSYRETWLMSEEKQ